MIVSSLFLPFLFVLGLLIGSFLNVVIVRLPHKKSLIRPPSHCPHCEHPIRWYENIPLLSFIFLKGKCSNCKNSISVRYPLIEFMTGVLFVSVGINFGWSPIIFFHDLPWVSILLAVTFIDLEHRLIPDPLSLGGLVIGLLTATFVPGLGLFASVIGAVTGFLFFYLIALFYLWRTGVSGLGGGDIKLLAMIGSFIGIKGVLTTILISSVTGVVIGIAYGLFKKEKQALMKVSIPYGPFLVVGALYYYFLGETLWSPFMNLM